MAFSQHVYSDFSTGYNDSVAAISIKDSEVCVSENADYSVEVRSFKTRAGSINLNTKRFNDTLRIAEGTNISASLSAPLSGSYEFIYDGAWKFKDVIVNIADYGISVYGTPKNGDKILASVDSVKTYHAGVEATDAHIWSIGSKRKICVVLDGKLYDYNDSDDSLLLKTTLSLGAKQIYPFTVFNKFYFGDGNELYVWGDFDHSASEGTKTVRAGEVVKNDYNASSGAMGHFYKARATHGSIDLKTASYGDQSAWDDVTEAPYFASSVCRPLKAYDPSRKEVVTVKVVKGATASGTITLYLNNVAFTCSVSANASIDAVANAIKAINTPGWTSQKVSNSITFTRDVAGLTIRGYIDPGATGCTLTYSTEQDGKADDNNLAPVKKCTMFVVHTTSYRVFATGNPDDNAVFYSEIGNPAYFRSDIDKVYALSSYGKPTGMLQLSDSVLISYENGWYSWDGITPLTDAKWTPLNLPYGCISHRSIALTPYSFIFLAKDGLYNISASILSSEMVLIQGEDVISKISQGRVDNTIAAITNKNFTDGIFHDNTYYLAYDSDDGQKVLKYEWGTRSFTTVTGWDVNCWATDGRELFFATRNYLMRCNAGICDIDVMTGEEKPINFYIKTKEYHFGNPLLNKVVRLIGFIFKQPLGLNDISAEINVITGYSKHQVDIKNISESLVWGRDWGLIWGFREAIVKMVEFIYSSNTFQIEIRNNALNSPITLVAIGFVYEGTNFVAPTILKDEVLLK